VRGYLITDFTRPTASELSNQLSHILDLVVIDPVWIRSDKELAVQSDQVVFKARHIHSPLRGEVGCALAHRNACESLLASDQGFCAVFEDDVRILDATELAVRMGFFEQVLTQEFACVINLNPDAAKRPIWTRKRNINKEWKPAIPTYTTSAYLINRRAAELIIREQTPIRSQADWPFRIDQVVFYQEGSTGLLRVEEIPSVIDPDRKRSRFPLRIKVGLWTWLWYLRYQDNFSGPADYWARVLKPRLYRHIYR